MTDEIQQVSVTHLSSEWGFEYRSKLELFGWPLVHVTRGYNPVTGKQRVSRGVIAIGEIAIGGLALGGFAFRWHCCWRYGGWCDRFGRAGSRRFCSRWDCLWAGSSGWWIGLFPFVCDRCVGIRTAYNKSNE